MNTMLVEQLTSLFGFIPNPGIRGLIQIAIISWMIYACLNWIKDTRSWALLRGLILIFGFICVCYAMNLNAILWILGRIAPTAVIALIIIFQPELRKALEQLGSRSFVPFSDLFTERVSETELSEHTVNELVKASFELGRARTGALMVLEQGILLDDIIRTGIDIDGKVSSQLLINIFEHNTPLHDGAVIIRGNRVVSATCYLPLSENAKIPKNLGTRHRAAVGISESTDSLTIVVSEETGKVSIARFGALTVCDDPEKLRKTLTDLSETQHPGRSRRHMRSFGLGFLRGKEKHEKETGQ